MGKQLPLFEAKAIDANDELNAAQAELRLASMQRQRPPFRPKNHRSVGRACPKCGAYVTIRVSST